MPSERFSVALRELTAGDWLLFERLASEFLAVDFPTLRTTAAPAGDRGRDGQMYVPGEDPSTVCQYSVTLDWSSKIRDTVRVLKKNSFKMTRLIYCTNQRVGPAADSLVEEFRVQGLAIDIRDASWFVDRELSAPQRAVAAEELSQRLVDPLLASRGIGERTGVVLTEPEARVALLHLTLEGYDQTSDKGLTRSCFESLVLSVLHDTSTAATKSRDDIRGEVSALVPAGERAQVLAQTDGALKRLSVRNGKVKQVGRTDDYHLSHDEQIRLRDATARFVARQDDVLEEVIVAVRNLSLDIDDSELRKTAGALLVGIESVLLGKGEAFATAVLTGEVQQLDVDEVMAILATRGEPLPHVSREAAAEVILELLERPGAAIGEHLRRLADGYTLFAFLRQTPDVQKVVLDVFSYGEVWLDTTVVLPLLAETLLEDPAERHYTALLRAAVDAGFKLFVTDGIVEEVERHLNRSLLFARTTTAAWNARVPFLYSAYALSGRSRSSYFDWLEEFRGASEPEEDIKEYLEDCFSIGSRNLLEYSDEAPQELRNAVQEIWHSAHDKRRNPADTDITPATTLRLVAHDVENCVGVIQLRKQMPSSPMGFRYWWLTLDRVALALPALMKDRMEGRPPASPALSPDFLAELLRLGPLRTDIAREVHVALPVVTAITRYESLPKELIELADATRKRYEGQNERVIRRYVKDALNEARWRVGSEAKDGLRGAEARVRDRLRAQATRRLPT